MSIHRRVLSLTKGADYTSAPFVVCSLRMHEPDRGLPADVFHGGTIGSHDHHAISTDLIDIAFAGNAF